MFRGLTLSIGAALLALGCVDLRAPVEIACGEACDAGGPPHDAGPDGAAADDGPAPPDDGPASPDDGPPPEASSPPDAAPADPTQYHFEQTVHGWRLLRPAGNTTTSRSIDHAYFGASSLAIDLDAPANQEAVLVGCTGSDLMVPPEGGTRVSFRVWFPADAPLLSIQPFLLDLDNGTGRWTGKFTFASALQAGAWNTIVLTTPAAYTSLAELGVEWRTMTAWRGTVYVDAVAW